MALIKCPECGRSLSDQAAACPHCGYPVNKEDIVQKSQEYVEAKKKESDKEHSKQLKIFWTAMMFGAFVGLPFFLGFLVIFTGIICGMGIMFGLVMIIFTSSNPLDFSKFSVMRTIWSFCTGATLSFILFIVLVAPFV